MRISLIDAAQDLNAAMLKRRQLEKDIQSSSATSEQKNNMQNGLDKMWMFLFDAIPSEVQKERNKNHVWAETIGG